MLIASNLKRRIVYKDERGYQRNSDNTREHRLIAEKVLNRKLKRNEIVHHIDYNKSNNKNSNLLICDRKYHNLIHARTDCILAGYSTNTHSRCSFHKCYEQIENFCKDKTQWNGLHAECRTATAIRIKNYRRRKGGNAAYVN